MKNNVFLVLFIRMYIANNCFTPKTDYTMCSELPSHAAAFARSDFRITDSAVVSGGCVVTVTYSPSTVRLLSVEDNAVITIKEVALNFTPYCVAVANLDRSNGFPIEYWDLGICFHMFPDSYLALKSSDTY
jgi:hypothetical protein